MIIFDIGSGNSLVDTKTAIQVIEEVAKIDTHKHEVIFKAQLFKKAPPNIPLDHHVFLVAGAYAKLKGYEMTASVFDIESLNFLMEKARDVPFVKIACRQDLYWLIGEVPRRIPVYVSIQTGKGIFPDQDQWWGDEVVTLCCVPEYPASIDDYPANSSSIEYSDHTVGLELWHRDSPTIWEKHLCLKRQSNWVENKNPDAGDWCLVPSDLEQVL